MPDERHLPCPILGNCSFICLMRGICLVLFSEIVLHMPDERPFALSDSQNFVLHMPDEGHFPRPILGNCSSYA